MQGDEIHRNSDPARLEGLLEKGLRCYSRGDIEGAMFEWQQVLKLDPAHAKARRFIKTVREQFPIPHEELRVVSTSGDEVPFGLEDLTEMHDEDSEAYAMLEIYKEPGEPAPDFEAAERTRGGAYASNIDEGWFLEDIPLNLTAVKDVSGEFKAQETFKQLADGLLDLGDSFDETQQRTNSYFSGVEPLPTEPPPVLRAHPVVGTDAEQDFSDLSVYGDSASYQGLPSAPVIPPAPQPVRKTDKNWMEMLALEPEPPPAAMTAESSMLGLDDVLDLAEQELSAVPEPIPVSKSMLDIEPLDEDAVPEPIPTPVKKPYSEGNPLTNPFSAGADLPSSYTAQAAPETEMLDLGRELATEVFGETPRPAATIDRHNTPTKQPPSSATPASPQSRNTAPTVQPPVTPPRGYRSPTAQPPISRPGAASTMPPRQIVLNADPPPSRNNAPTAPPPVAPARAKAPSTAPPRQIVINADPPPRAASTTAQPPMRTRAATTTPPKPAALDAPQPRTPPAEAPTPTSLRKMTVHSAASGPAPMPPRAVTLRGQPPIQRGAPSVPPPIPYEVPLGEPIDLPSETLDLKEAGRLPSPVEPTLSDTTVDLADLDTEPPIAKRRRPTPMDAAPELVDIIPGSDRLANLYRDTPSPETPAHVPADKKESVQVATARIYGEAEALCSDSIPADERVSIRVNFFFERAEKEFSAENPKLAAAIMELAIDEAPGNAVAQKAIQSNRDLILEIYRGYLGNLKAVVTIALPMQQLSKYELDPRAAFLLSRIDGTMSIEDILDISGMPALEAYQLLSKLRMQGIIDLR